jgi:hypothetical protein
MKTFELVLKVIPQIKDESKRIIEEKVLLDLWLAMDEIKAKVSYQQMELLSNPSATDDHPNQMSLF